MKELLGKIFDPKQAPSLTAILSAIAFFVGLPVCIVGAFKGIDLVADYGFRLVVTGIAGKAVQTIAGVFNRG